MNKANHRAFARSVSIVTEDHAVLAAARYQKIYKSYLIVMKKYKDIMDSPRVDRMFKRWLAALERAVNTIPTTWAGVVALLDICTDDGSIGESIEDLQDGVNSISAGVRRLLATEFEAV